MTRTCSLDGEDGSRFVFFFWIEGRVNFEWGVRVSPYFLRTVFFVISVKTTTYFIHKISLLVVAHLFNDLILTVVFVFIHFLYFTAK